jgi:predicted acylesterase/phospholipase RssA
MKPLRENVAIAIDGGGIRGVIATRALMMLEEALGLPVHQVFRLTAGTSTGSVIAAGIAAGLPARQMHQLYLDLGPTIFPKTLRSILWPLSRYRYDSQPLEYALHGQIGDLIMGDFWSQDPPTDVVITTFDLGSNHTRFVKPWKSEYRDWPVVKAVLASSAVPTYFPVVEGRYVDGGVGSYANPCYLAAYELRYCLGWDLEKTTLISLGTGRGPHHFDPQQANRLWAWQWISPLLGAFMQSADDQQVHLVDTFFPGLDFRRFQVDLSQPIEMDDVSKIPRLVVYGEEMGRKILNDQIDWAQRVSPKMAPLPQAL